MKNKIFVDIDVLCNWKNKLIDLFTKEVGDYNSIDLTEVDIKDMWRHFDFPKFIEVINDKSVNGVQFENDIKEVAMIQDESAEHEPSLEYFNQYLADNVVEIFGHALERQKGSTFKLAKLLKDNELTVYSKYSGRIRPSQLFFLANYGYQGDVKFLSSDEIETLENKIDTIEKLKELI